MISIRFLITAAAAALSINLPALGMPAGKVLGSAVVDGFTVNLLRFPTVARLPKPSSSSGDVTTGAGADGTNPYGNSALAGSAFLSMNTGGSVRFSLKHPASAISLIWGTPDSYNYISLYDTSGNLIGTLNGGDISGAFGFTTGQYVQIRSPSPVGSVTAWSDGCCFEVGNMGSVHAVR